LVDEDTTIIGAGPYGLSLAAHMKAAGLSYRLIGPPMESWRKFMPVGMILRSESFASNLWDPARQFTVERFLSENGLKYQAVGRPLTLEQFLRYAEWFQAQAVGHTHNLKVTRLSKCPSGFALELDDGSSFTSRRVILASGHMAFRTLPAELLGLSEPAVCHSTRLGDIKSYSGRDVVVIGAGQSALETAALLHEAGACVRLLVRDDHIVWNAVSKPRPFWKRLIEPDAGTAPGWRNLALSELPRTFHWYFRAYKRHWFVVGGHVPSGAWWLKDRVDGRIEVWMNSQVEAVELNNGRVQLRIDRPDGVAHIEADHVIAATGFKVDIDKLSYLDRSLRRGIKREGKAAPVLDQHFESSVPGLFVVGLASALAFGPVMRFVFGAKHAAPVVARRLRTAK
jgi:FAD-dependent urate hydroxylase